MILPSLSRSRASPTPKTPCVEVTSEDRQLFLKCNAATTASTTSASPHNLNLDEAAVLPVDGEKEISSSWSVADHFVDQVPYHIPKNSHQ